MAKKKSYIRESLSLLGATLPLLGLNALVYFGFFLVAVLWIGFWGVLAALGFWIHFIAGWVPIIIGLGSFWWIWRMARRYFLYLVKGAHIAAITEIMCGRDVPRGMAQIKYGRSVVEKYFKDVSILFGVDILVRAAVKKVTGTVVRLVNWLPLPGNARKLLNVIRQIINKSLDYVDAAILSYAIRQGSQNVWQSARHGVILYAQSYKGILMTAAKAWGIGKVLDLLVFVMAMVPVVALTAVAGDEVGTVVFIVGLILAGIFAKIVELAVYEPFANAYVIVTYHRETENLQPDPEWDQKLQGMSNKFKELVGKAENFEPAEGDAAPALPSGQEKAQAAAEV